ncbi:MAG: winged helix-turn-helix transcriptional regulator [Acidimicrobiales bacterium]
MTTRGPRQLCSLTVALELVSQPWALLVVEALLEGPLQPAELADALPGIDATTLRERLGELQDAGLIAAPDCIGHPELLGLTAVGRGLEPSIRALGGWGATVESAAVTESQVLPQLLVGLVRRLVGDGQTSEVNEAYELRVGKHVLHVDIDEGRTEVRPGPAQAPSVIVEASVEWLCDLAAGGEPVANTRSGEGVTWSGDAEARGRCARALGP